MGYLHSDSDWAWKFRTLEARAALQRGLYDAALKLLRAVPLPSSRPSLAIPILTIEGEAYAKVHDFPAAENALAQATDRCAGSAEASCGYVLKALGLLASERNQWEPAEKYFGLALAFARAHTDAVLESYALLNLGYDSLAEGRFDESIDRSEEAYRKEQSVGARRLALKTQGNIGWAYYKLGDSEKALELFKATEELAAQLGDVSDQENLLTDIGYIHMDGRRYDLAAAAFHQAMGLASGIDAREDVYNALRALARLYLQTGDLDRAGEYAGQALASARRDGNPLDELYPKLVAGQIAARRREFSAAEAMFHQVEGDGVCPVFLKWEAEHALARMYEEERRPEMSEREYRAALTTFESARDEVRHEDSQISFLTNASHIYDDFVHFLVARGRADEALRWADYSRGRTLAQGLGLLSRKAGVGPPALNSRKIASEAKGTLLFYWLGESQSYLWAIGRRTTSLFVLPPGAEIEAAAQRYRRTLGGPLDVLASADPDGRWLYDRLVAPAQPMLAPGVKVFVIPDGSLNNLNFETLLVPDAPGREPAPSGTPVAAPKLHFWIEDAVLVNASSLRVLAAGRGHASRATGGRTLLLVGNSIAPNDKYPELPKAAAQMEAVGRHFSAARERVLARGQATPAAYLQTAPERFAYIHFVAHGTASRVSPLDSAIILSNPENVAHGGAPGETATDAFKLYARDIIHQPLRAELVTISACYGAGEHAYSGEGLVGLSWAFLLAGAHHVIAALWEATDASTALLMDDFYGELDRGASPDTALHAAKLRLLRSGSFRNPFYWAPFQIYSGS